MQAGVCGASHITSFCDMIVNLTVFVVDYRFPLAVCACP